MNAREWLASGGGGGVSVLGVPISKASISASDAWSTPAAVRDALTRFSTWDAQHGVDLADLPCRDLGDVPGDHDDPDAAAAHGRIEQAARMHDGDSVLVLIGGDNSLTRPALLGLMASDATASWGLLTLDAHHDCRPPDKGSRNGTPVRELIEAGLPGDRVAQVGIQPFANQRSHAEWALAQGIHVFSIAEVRSSTIATVVVAALDAITRAGAERIYADIDVDVTDRAFAPACPASLPGGLWPYELLEAAFLLGSSRRVEAVDLTEVDAKADLNLTTVRLTAAVLLAFCSGVAARR